MHRLTILTCETLSQFNDNLRTQFNEGKGYQGIRTFKTFEFKNIQVMPKNVELTEKKEKQYARRIIYSNQGHLPTKSPLILSLKMNHSFNLMIQL